MAKYTTGIPWYTDLIDLKYTIKDKFSGKTREIEENGISTLPYTDRSFGTSNKDIFAVAGDTLYGEGTHDNYVNPLTIKRTNIINDKEYTFAINLYKECYPDHLIEKIDSINSDIELHSFTYSYIKVKHRYAYGDQTKYYDSHTYCNIYSDDADFGKGIPLNSYFTLTSYFDNPILSIGIKTKSLDEVEDLNPLSYDSIYIFPTYWSTGSTYFKYKSLLSAYYPKLITNVESYSFTYPGSNDEDNTIEVIYGYPYSSISVPGFKYTFEQRNEWKVKENEIYSYKYNFIDSEYESYMPSVILNSFCIGTSEINFDTTNNNYTGVTENSLTGNAKNMSSGSGNVELKFSKEYTFTDDITRCLITFKEGGNIDKNSNNYIVSNSLIRIYYDPLLEVSPLSFSYSGSSYNINIISNNTLTYDYKYFNVSETIGTTYTSTLFAAIKYDPNDYVNDINVSINNVSNKTKNSDGILFDTSFNLSSKSKNNDSNIKLMTSRIKSNYSSQTWVETNNSISSGEYIILGTYLTNGSTKRSMFSYTYISYVIANDNILSYVKDGNTYIYLPGQDTTSDVKIILSSTPVEKILFDKYNYDPKFTYSQKLSNIDNDKIEIYNITSDNNINKYIIGSLYNVFISGNDNLSYIDNNFYDSESARNGRFTVDLNYGSTVNDNPVYQYISSHLSDDSGNPLVITILNKNYGGEENSTFLSVIKKMFMYNSLLSFIKNSSITRTFNLNKNNINITEKNNYWNKYIEYLFENTEVDGDSPYDYNFENYEVNEDIINVYYTYYKKLDDEIAAINTPTSIHDIPEILSNIDFYNLNVNDSNKRDYIVKYFNAKVINDAIASNEWKDNIQPYSYFKMYSSAPNEIYMFNSIDYLNREYKLYKLNDSNNEEEYSWAYYRFGAGFENKSFASYIYSVTQTNDYATAKKILYAQSYILGGTYSYAFEYLSEKYAEDDIHKLTYINFMQNEGEYNTPITNGNYDSLIDENIRIALIKEKTDNGYNIYPGNEWETLSNLKDSKDNEGISIGEDGNYYVNMIIDKIKDTLSFSDNYVHNIYNTYASVFDTSYTLLDYATYYSKNNTDKSPIIRNSGNNIILSDNTNYSYSSFYTTYNFCYNNNFIVKNSDNYINDINNYYTAITYLCYLYDNLKYNQYTYKYSLTVNGNLVTETNNINIEYDYEPNGYISDHTGGYHRYSSSYYQWSRTGSGTEGDPYIYTYYINNNPREISNPEITINYKQTNPHTTNGGNYVIYDGNNDELLFFIFVYVFFLI